MKMNGLFCSLSDIILSLQLAALAVSRRRNSASDFTPVSSHEESFCCTPLNTVFTGDAYRSWYLVSHLPRPISERLESKLPHPEIRQMLGEGRT